MKFPKKVYVYINSDEAATFIVAVHGVDEIPDEIDRELVGTYKLKRIQRLKVRRVLK